MLNIKNIFKISILSIMVVQFIYANDLYSENSFYKKIDTHFLNLNRLSAEDCENISYHSNMSDIYNCEHDDKIKKDRYLKVESKISTTKDSLIKANSLDNNQVRTNKERLQLERKDRMNRFRPLNPKSKSLPFNGLTFNSSSFEFVPFHFEAPLADK